jgi:CubicO group peptidase (beta-lactamase class C family)
MSTPQFLLTVVALLLAIVRPAAADAIDDIVRDDMAKRHVPGVAIAVVKDGQTVKLAAYGLADVENDVPVTPKTVFQIQSVTKTMTAAAILLLADEGKLAIDDPVSKHLADTPDTWKEITLRHLLSHTSGIKDFINEPKASLRLEVTEQEVFKASADRPLNFKPGEKYQYSNTGYHLLAMVIRKHAGKSYGEFLAERFFSPLGLSQTRVNDLSAVIPHRAGGYRWDGKALRRGDFVADSIISYGGGGVLTSAADMAEWAKALSAGKVLKRELLEQAWTSAKLNDGKPAGYGLGWVIGRQNGRRLVAHGGAHMTGFTSHFAHYPDDGLTVVVLTNSRQGDPARIGRRIAAMVEPKQMPPEPKPIEDRNPELTKLTREILEKMADGVPAPKGMTAQMWAVFLTQAKPLQDLAKARGAIRSVTLIAREEADGHVTHIYRAVGEKAVTRVRVVTNKDGVIAGWWMEDE